uniref:Reverse transcriptase/retrotransposon-derived protein RNase H-like domain-containing protein n=1 Tax=Arundo donax TaxID=35708 RepID=A0A0A9QQM6_ARUDO
MKMSKCSFAQQSISYLGHAISKEGVSTDHIKIATMRDWPVPTCVKELRSFLGLAGYYRKFVRHFGSLSRPLIDLLCKKVLFIWTPETDASFQALKKALITVRMLALPDFSSQFYIETDASETGGGSVNAKGSSSGLCK